MAISDFSEQHEQLRNATAAVAVVAGRVLVDQGDEPVLDRVQHEQPDLLLGDGVVALEAAAGVPGRSEWTHDHAAGEVDAFRQFLVERLVALRHVVDLDAEIAGLAEFQPDAARRPGGRLRGLEQFAGELER